MALKADQLHFLLVPLMSQSHIIPLMDFGKLLARRGILVSMVTTPHNAIRYRGAIDQAKAQNLRIQMLSIRFPCQEAGLPDGCENMDALNSLESSREFFLACEMLRDPLEKLIQELEPKPNCIVSTSAIPWTQEVAQRFNIPRYVFQTVSCFTLLCSNILSRSSVEENLVSDSEPFLMPGIPDKVEFTRAQLPTAMMKKDSADGIAKIVEKMKQAADSARGTLVNSFQELEPWYVEGYKKESNNVWCIGPVSLCNKDLDEKSGRGDQAAIDEHYCVEWLDSMKPKSVIYACFGSLCRLSLAQIKETGLGLEASNCPFIWIIRKQDYSREVENWLAEVNFQERVGGRGLVIPGWAPQILILSHPSVGGFLTHCGWNSTLEGVCAGVPMITWPMFAEQFYNEKLIVDVLGIGVKIGVEVCMNYEESGGLVKRDRVKKAIENLMDENDEGSKRRKRAADLAYMARNATEEGGSSYSNVTMLIQDVVAASS